MRHFKRVLSDPVSHNKALEEYMTMTPAQPNDPTNSAKPPTPSPQPDAVQAALAYHYDPEQINWGRLIEQAKAMGLDDDPESFDRIDYGYVTSKILAAEVRRLEQRVAELVAEQAKYEMHVLVPIDRLDKLEAAEARVVELERELREINDCAMVAADDPINKGRKVFVAASALEALKESATKAEAALAAAQKRIGELEAEPDIVEKLRVHFSYTEMKQQLAGARRKLEAQSLALGAKDAALDAVRKLTPDDWEFTEYLLTADNAHTPWKALAKLRAALAPVERVANPAAQPPLTDHKGQPMTYWGGAVEPEQACDRCSGDSYLYTIVGTVPCPKCNRPAQPEREAQQKEAT